MSGWRSSVRPRSCHTRCQRAAVPISSAWTWRELSRRWTWRGRGGVGLAAGKYIASEALERRVGAQPVEVRVLADQPVSPGGYEPAVGAGCRLLEALDGLAGQAVGESLLQAVGGQSRDGVGARRVVVLVPRPKRGGALDARDAH